MEKITLLLAVMFSLLSIGCGGSKNPVKNRNWLSCPASGIVGKLLPEKRYRITEFETLCTLNGNEMDINGKKTSHGQIDRRIYPGQLSERVYILN